MAAPYRLVCYTATVPTPIRIRDDGPPPYEQLRDRVAALIARGRWLPGDRVPTVRALADELGLAPNTVARAYRALEADGWLVGRGRAGTFVADHPPARAADPETALEDAADRYLRRAAQLGFDARAARAMLDRVGRRP
ncbi:MAG TPA: GntR family transcriptional regulator [Actinomycetota bacterium]